MRNGSGAFSTNESYRLVGWKGKPSDPQSRKLLCVGSAPGVKPRGDFFSPEIELRVCLVICE
ncbi:hypothetical protein STRATTON_287 [Erwinia phage vB_EamM_Stratton]|uniref:Uncharacterized protein n=1 Tax=Erwinia phage vB_EamM_Stratton TaxID=1883378 RepID=A0A1B2IHJ4_9CAUD|nr:hypothetical protein STRATTON_287 [Erwinia phage vB_EamM_Stratton]